MHVQHCVAFIWVALAIWIVVVACISLTAAPVRTPVPIPPTPNDTDSQGSNVYFGYGDTAESSISGGRRATENTKLFSYTVQNLQIKCRADIAALLNKPYLNTTVLGGTFETQLQADETHIYGVFYASPPSRMPSGIVKISRETCDVEWHLDAADLSTQAAKVIAAKYPSLYNQNIVNSFVRSYDDTDVCITQITLLDTILVATDTCVNNVYFSSDAYYESRPKAMDGYTPLLGHNWGVTNDERHLIQGNVYIINATDGALLDAEKAGDMGEDEALGYCAPLQTPRLPVAFVDPADNQTYVFTNTRSGGWQSFDWTRVSRNQTRFEGAINAGNRLPFRGSVLKMWHIDENGMLTEAWRRYDTPTPLFAGDANPMNVSHVFATDDEAEQYNFHTIGIYSAATVDLDRRQIVVPGHSGLFMPIDLIRAAHIAPSLTGFPDRTYVEWIDLQNDAVNVAEQAAVYESWKQTQQDRIAAIQAIPGNRYDELLSNAVNVLSIDDGSTVWQHRHVATDTELPHWFQIQIFPTDVYTNVQYVSYGGYNGYYIAAIHDDDRYIIPARDGTMQILSADDGSVISDQRYIHDFYGGSFMRTMTIDDNHAVYLDAGWDRDIEWFFGLRYIITYNPETDGVVVGGNVDCQPGSCPNADGNWYVNSFIDTYNDLGNGEGAVYQNQNTPLPFEVRALLKIDSLTGALIVAATLEPPESRPAYDAGMAISSANDVIFIPKHNGIMEAWDMTLMQPIWSYDTNPDVNNLPFHPGTGSRANAPMTPVGSEVWVAVGDDGAPGKYIYAFKVPE